MGYKTALRVWRGDAGAGELADYQVEVNEGEVVLDVLHRLQATQASDLAIRWNCKAVDGQDRQAGRGARPDRRASQPDRRGVGCSALRIRPRRWVQAILSCSPARARAAVRDGQRRSCDVG
jgi:hypothetical protein